MASSGHVVSKIDFRTKEGYDKASWEKEGQRHLRSARTLRRSRQRRRSALSHATPDRMHHHIAEMEAAVHSSTLLVGYSIETFLKAGLTALYRGCSKALFEEDVKKRYGHNLIKLADAIEFPQTADDETCLERMREVVVGEGRYPYLSATPDADMKSRNERAFEFWSDGAFRRYAYLAEQIQEHVGLIDNDTQDPFSFISRGIDGDGYFAFRCGGNLRPRITVKFSALQKETASDSKDALRALILANVSDPNIERLWDSAEYREVRK